MSEGRTRQALTVAVDFGQPQSHLAVEPTLELARELGVRVDWQPFLVAPLARPAVAEPGEARGAAHLRLRARYVEDDLRRYAADRGVCLGDVYRSEDSSVAARGLLFLQSGALDEMELDVVDVYVQRVFESYGNETLHLGDTEAIRSLLHDMGTGAGFDPEAWSGELDRAQSRLRDAGVIGAPTYLVGDELFLGRQHLPMIRWIWKGRSGPLPI